jgi:hypothetical protein
MSVVIGVANNNTMQKHGVVCRKGQINVEVTR